VTDARVIVLNGATSAGKSTLAKALQRGFAARGEAWIVIALDDFFARVPPEWFQIGDHCGPHAEAGMVFESVNGSIERRVGPFGRTLLSAYRSVVAAITRAGLDVIVDEVLLSTEDWDGWRHELAGLDVTWVAVEAPLDVLLVRERERGDRVVGMAAAQFNVVHSFATYAVRVDTTELTAEKAADVIMASLAV
jgi:chloramphenicol 3-O phosphotransferase